MSFFSLASISAGTIHFTGSFMDGCIQSVIVSGPNNAASLSFVDPPAPAVSCGQSDESSRFARYFGANFTGGYAVSNETLIIQISADGTLRRRQDSTPFVFTYNFVGSTATTTTATNVGGVANAATTTATVASGAPNMPGGSNSVGSGQSSYVAPSPTYAPPPAGNNLYKGAATPIMLSSVACTILLFLL